MAANPLGEFIEKLEKSGELLRIKEYVSPHLQMTEIADRISKSDGMALLFENNGSSFPVLMNAFGSERRICMALGVTDLGEPGRRIDALLKMFGGGPVRIISQLGELRQASRWFPKSVRGRGVCQEVVMDPPDLGQLPVLTCWPADGGPFITLPVVHTRDPKSGKRNVGMYRMQVFDGKTTGMHWHLHKNSARHFRAYRASGQRMPVVVTLGGDPAYTYAATAPMPDGMDEYLLAGFLRKRKVKLVKCLTCELEVPEDVDFVIEGYVDPAEELVTEGPFGDHTGFYSLADLYPRFHVTCITHRRDAVYPATIVGIPPQEDYYMGKATERIFLSPIRLSLVPEISDMHMPAEGVFHNLAIISLFREFEGQAQKVMNALWGAGQMMLNKFLIITNSGTDIRSPHEVMQCISRNVDPGQDLHISKGPADVLDHSSRQFALSGKAGLDAGNERGLTFRPESLQADRLLLKFPAIHSVDTRLIEKGYPILIVFSDKKSGVSVRNLHQEICAVGEIGETRFIIYFDPEAEGLQSGDYLWLAGNHCDPAYDLHLSGGKTTKVLGLDATVKTHEDGFMRPWPNPVLMDDANIVYVDDHWARLTGIPFIPSPSHQYKRLSVGEGAVRQENDQP